MEVNLYGSPKVNIEGATPPVLPKGVFSTAKKVSEKVKAYEKLISKTENLTPPKPIKFTHAEKAIVIRQERTLAKLDADSIDKEDNLTDYNQTFIDPDSEATKNFIAAHQQSTATNESFIDPAKANEFMKNNPQQSKATNESFINRGKEEVESSKESFIQSQVKQNEIPDEIPEEVAQEDLSGIKNITQADFKEFTNGLSTDPVLSKEIANIVDGRTKDFFNTESEQPTISNKQELDKVMDLIAGDIKELLTTKFENHFKAPPSSETTQTKANELVEELFSRYQNLDEVNIQELKGRFNQYK